MKFKRKSKIETRLSFKQLEELPYRSSIRTHRFSFLLRTTVVYFIPAFTVLAFFLIFGKEKKETEMVENKDVVYDEYTVERIYNNEEFNRSMLLIKEFKAIPVDSNAVYEISVSEDHDFEETKVFSELYSGYDLLVQQEIADTTNTQSLFFKDNNKKSTKKRIKVSKKNIPQKKLQHGYFNFYIDSTMLVGKGYQALLVFSKINGIKNDKQLEKIEKTNPDIIDSLSSNTIVKADLNAAAGSEIFNILTRDINFKSLNIPNKRSVIWEWIVSPLKEGTHDIVLKISPPNSKLLNNVQYFPARSYPINAIVENKSIIDKINYFFTKYSVLTSVVGAIILFIVTYIIPKRRRKSYQY